MDYKKMYAIKNNNKKRIIKYCPNINNDSGIYILTRFEDGFKYAYIGQAKHLLDRLANHLEGYQHIDLSLKKHKFYDNDNPNGWQIEYFNCDIEDLDKKEQEYILKYANEGYQLRNKTAGGQGEGKKNIAETKAPKGYRDGLKQGRKNLAKEIKHLFDLHLDVTQKSNKPNKNQEKALAKFWELIEYDNKE